MVTLDALEIASEAQAAALFGKNVITASFFHAMMERGHVEPSTCNAYGKMIKWRVNKILPTDSEKLTLLRSIELVCDILQKDYADDSDSSLRLTISYSQHSLSGPAGTMVAMAYLGLRPYDLACFSPR
jgi:hypothetical protein